MYAYKQNNNKIKQKTYGNGYVFGIVGTQFLWTITINSNKWKWVEVDMKIGEKYIKWMKLDENEWKYGSFATNFVHCSF